MKIHGDRLNICGWSTDVLSIDPDNGGGFVHNPHTLILFIPGNPGVIHWYIDFLCKIIQHLGDGYAIRGVSYAGHGVGDEVVGTDAEHNSNTREDKMKMHVAWTMDGQVKHKAEWVDRILTDFNIKYTGASVSQPYKNVLNLIFLSHSIGAHIVQCLLIERPDLLSKTQRIIHLMPFFRFDPPLLKKVLLSKVAHNHERAIPFMTAAVRFASSKLSRRFLDLCMEKIAGVECDKGRQIAIDIFLSSKMMRNHLVLGTQEIRELPELPNDIALRLIGEVCSTSILFCGCPDQWAPLFHMKDLERMQLQSEIPSNITALHIDELRHDFVVHPKMIDPVVQFCIQSMKQSTVVTNQLSSKL